MAENEHQTKQVTQDEFDKLNLSEYQTILDMVDRTKQGHPVEDLARATMKARKLQSALRSLDKSHLTNNQLDQYQAMMNFCNNLLSMKAVTEGLVAQHADQQRQSQNRNRGGIIHAIRNVFGGGN